MTDMELKDWILNNGFKLEGNKFSPGMVKRINKTILIRETLYTYTSFLEDQFEPFICERILYFMNSINEQKVCPVCGVPIKFRRDNCSAKCASNNKEVKQQREETCLKIYGTTNPSLSTATKEKISASNKQLSEQALIKRNETNKSICGHEHFLQSEHHLNKAKQTTLERYGVDNYFKTPEFIVENKVRLLNRTEEESKKQIPKWFKTALNKGLIYNYEHATPLFDEDDWNQNIYDREFKCNICDGIFKIHSTSINRCTHCFPINITLAENEILEFIGSIYKGEIKHTDRRTISPLELDINLPIAKLAVEYNGLLYHSYGRNDKTSYLNNFDKEDSKYHLNKTKLCEAKNIQLLHIFENEWVDSNKKDIWKSIIISKLGLSKIVYARKCTIKTVSSKDAQEFLIENHLQGNCSASIKLGLYYNDELFSLITLSTPRYNKKYDWELIRFCNKKYTSVVGGFAKLLSFFRKNNHGSIITYADKRYSSGELYKNNKFTELKDSNPNYFYWKNHTNILQSRLKFQKHKLKYELEVYDDSLTEFHNMINNDYRRIWDCGNKVFELL